MSPIGTLVLYGIVKTILVCLSSGLVTSGDEPAVAGSVLV